MPAQRIQRHLVVADHAHLFTQLAEILHEVVGEAVVVVDHQDHGRLSIIDSN
jgi:hypothetical protein